MLCEATVLAPGQPVVVTGDLDVLCRKLLVLVVRLELLGSLHGVLQHPGWFAAQFAFSATFWSLVLEC